MKIIYTLHARMRMLERGITEDDVEFILSNPDIIDEGRNQTLIANKKINNKVVRVIYSLQNNKIIVITVY